LVELCSVTSLTPSIRRRRSSVSATSDWLVAQPLRVKVGTLPGGVAEVTDGLEAAPALAALVEPVEAAAGVAAVAVDEPIVPVSEEIVVPRGSTRPSSWKE
jgi:hypothetical protein